MDDENGFIDETLADPLFLTELFDSKYSSENAEKLFVIIGKTLDLDNFKSREDVKSQPLENHLKLLSLIENEIPPYNFTETLGEHVIVSTQLKMLLVCRVMGLTKLEEEVKKELFAIWIRKATRPKYDAIRGKEAISNSGRSNRKKQYDDQWGWAKKSAKEVAERELAKNPKIRIGQVVKACVEGFNSQGRSPGEKPGDQALRKWLRGLLPKSASRSGRDRAN